MPFLLVSARRGHEKAVLRDLLDALFPYDHRVRGALEGWTIRVETSIRLDELQQYLDLFPIRNLVTVRYVLAVREPGHVDKLVEELPRLLAEAGVKASKIRVHLSAGSGWSQEYFRAIKKALIEKGLMSKEGWPVAVEEKSGKIVMSVLLKPRVRGSPRSALP